mgnify:FL=1
MEAQYHVIKRVVETKKRKRGGLWFKVEWQSDNTQKWIPRRHLDTATAAAYDQEGNLIKKSRTVPIGPEYQAVIPEVQEVSPYEHEFTTREHDTRQLKTAMNTPILAGTKLMLNCPTHFPSEEQADADIILCQGQHCSADRISQREVLNEFNLKLRDIDIDYDKKHIVRKVDIHSEGNFYVVTILCWLKNGTCVDLQCLHPHSDWWDEERNRDIPNWSEVFNYPYILDTELHYSKHKAVSDSTIHSMTSKLMMDLKKQFFTTQGGVYPPLALTAWENTVEKVWEKIDLLSQDIKNANSYA